MHQEILFDAHFGGSELHLKDGLIILYNQKHKIISHLDNDSQEQAPQGDKNAANEEEIMIMSRQRVGGEIIYNTFRWNLEMFLTGGSLQSIMNIRISICLLTLTLLPVITPICQSSSQLNGLCTACPQGQTLSFGFCLSPIPGCISQLSNGLCSQCGAGYTFNGWACSLGNGNSGAASSNLDLYSDDGPDKRYELLDYYFKQKYVSSLRDKISDIGRLISLPTTYGYIYALTYYNPYSNAAIYYAQAIVDYFYNITEYSFSTTPPAYNGKSTLLWFVNRQAVVNNLATLAPYMLNKVQQLTVNDYRLFFMDYSGRIQVVDVQRTPNPSSTAISFPALTQLYYAINQNTAINYVFSEFPTLQMHTNYTASYYSLLDPYGNSLDYFKFIFDNQIVITVQVNALTFSVYSYDEPNSVIANATASLGGYLPLLTLTDPIYLSVYNALITSYPFLQYKTVQQVRYQLVAGTNFIIIFNALPFSNDQYMALAYQPLSGSPTVTNVLKNGIDITNTIMSQPINAYNYEADSRFKALYNYFKNNLVSTLGALLPIYQVLYSANANGTFNYQVIYNNVESCQLQYSPSLSNPYLILSYSAMGVAVPTTPSPSAQLGSDITRNALLSFLVQEKPSLFSSFLVVSISQISPGIFNIDLLTLYGTYFARVVNSGLLILTGVSMTSTNLCSDLASSEFTANPAVVTLNTYLQANYPSINGYSLSLVQGFMSGNNANYRLVYSQGTNRYEFLMSYSGNLGKYITSKATQYGGAGCDLSSVLIGSQCVRSCIAFSF